MRQTNCTALGMLMGIAVGGGLGVILFAITSQALWLALGGVGVGIGLSLGAGLDRARSR